MNWWYAILWSSITHALTWVAVIVFDPAPPVDDVSSPQLAESLEQVETEIGQDLLRPTLERATQAQLAAIEQAALPDWQMPRREDLNEDRQAIAPQEYYQFGKEDQELSRQQDQASIHGLEKPSIDFGLVDSDQISREQRSKLIDENLQRLQQAAAFIHHVVFRDKRSQLQRLLKQHPVTNHHIPVEITISQDQRVTSARLIGTSGNANVDQWLQGVLIHFLSTHHSIGLPPLKEFRQQELILLDLKRL